MSSLLLAQDGEEFPPRPRTATSRPGTANGNRRHFGQFGSFSNQGPALQSTNSSNALSGEIGKDSLLRILNSEAHYLHNQTILCSETGDVEGLRKLIAQGGAAVVQCRGLNGYTPLHHACARGNAAVVAELLELRLPIDARNDGGETALHLAVYAGNILIVDQLLDCGADVNAFTKDNETPLMYAARRSMPAIIRLLLHRGADHNLADKYGDVAISHTDDEHTLRAFEMLSIGEEDHDGEGSSVMKIRAHIGGVVGCAEGFNLRYKDLLRVFTYLGLTDLLKSACVSTKWHRVAENDELWQKLGVRRWELALRSSLGFSRPSTSFLLMRTSSFSSKERGSKKSGGNMK